MIGDHEDHAVIGPAGEETQRRRHKSRPVVDLRVRSQIKWNLENVEAGGGEIITEAVVQEGPRRYSLQGCKGEVNNKGWLRGYLGNRGQLKFPGNLEAVRKHRRAITSKALQDYLERINAEQMTHHIALERRLFALVLILLL